ncbi:MAG: FtsX-like permease family protein [Syntrophothermus sp.]
MKKILYLSSVRFFISHPLQLAFSLLGIALGVAVVVAVDLANSSAAAAFKLSMQSVAGRATHQIISTSEYLPDSLYTFIKKRINAIPAAPVAEGQMKIAEKGAQVFTLLGVDPFAEKPFRSFTGSGGMDLKYIAPFLTEPGALLLSSETALELKLKEKDSLTLRTGGNLKKAFVLGRIIPGDDLSRRALENLLVTDISTAQEILNMTGKLSRIDLIIPEDNNQTVCLNKIKSLLPAGTDIIRSESRNEIAMDMVRAFDINLTALSLLALIVGMFLIYNTMTFSIVQRKRYIGLIRLLGAQRNEVLKLFLTEALVQGLIGTVAGILLGVLLGTALVNIVTRTINDLYFAVTVREINISWMSLLKGFATGLAATVISALKPAIESASVSPGIVMIRSEQETRLKHNIPGLAKTGLLFLAAGTLILKIPVRSLIISYLGVLPIILGFSLLTPLMITWFVKIMGYAVRSLLGPTGKIALNSIVRQLSRTSLAVAALSLAVASAIGIGTMVSSFRQTVVKWLEGNLRADVYISAPALVQRQNETNLDTALVSKIIKLPGIAEYNFYKNVTSAGSGFKFNTLALKLDRQSFLDFKFREGDPESIWPEFQDNDAAIVTEPSAYKNNLSSGDTIEIPSPEGWRKFVIRGVYYDYTSDLGFAVISYNTYKKYWNDNRITGLSLILKDKSEKEKMISRIRSMPDSDEEIIVRSGENLKNASIEVFDRTFMITQILQVLAVIVAFIGILSTLMALQLERSREFAILRANGLTPFELWKLLIMQTGFMGIIAGLLSLPLGNLLAWILINIINKRSFGWTLQFSVVPGILLQAFAVSVTAAVIAGLYPALKMSKTPPAFALREE